MIDRYESKETEVRLLVTDYDHCAARADSERPDLLSSPLIKRATDPQYNYKGFYGCTFRCNLTAFFVKHTSWNPSFKWYFARHQDKVKNLSTSNITRNLEDATKLKCHGVSMLSDAFLEKDKCNSTFKRRIQPYEASNRKVHCDFITSMPRELMAYCFGNKNYQLLQIAQDAAKRYPNVTITLDFVDDNLKLGKQALKAQEEYKAHWPTNVKINALNHKTQEIVPVTPDASAKSGTCLSRVGLFAGASAAAATVCAAGATALHSLWKRNFAASTA